MDDVNGRQSATRSSTQVERELLKTMQPAPVVWAVDAFSEHFDVSLTTASILRRYFPESPIYPVYVLSEESFTERGFSTFLKPALKPMAIKALSSLLASMRIGTFGRPRVLIEPTGSRPACARKLLRFARKVGAGLIAMGSHGHRGLSRLLVGSFSESILDHSSCPVLFVGPSVTSTHLPPKRIVFATDFSSACSAAFDGVLNLAKIYGAEIHLFHKDTNALDPIAQNGAQLFGGGWLSVDAYLSQPAPDTDEDAGRWVRRGEAAGIKTIYVHEKFREPTSNAIVQYMSRFDGASALLAMVSQSGPVASALLGSVTRDVIRSSPCPVYVVPRLA